MQLCLHDPVDGYYATRPGIGRDFITAPEISQIFGELIGLWVVNEWQAMGEPDPFCLVECGPGRAQLLSDAFRVMNMSKAGRDCLSACQLHLLEHSETLRNVQSRALSDYQPKFLDTLEQTPSIPKILIANEFLDCLPARQFKRKENGTWHEKKVGLKDGALVIGVDDGQAVELEISDKTLSEIEIQPGLETFVLTLADWKRSTVPFRALLIDYGPADHPPTDSLRAFQNGEQVNPFKSPGEADLTVDVDFSAMKHLALQNGLNLVGPIEQGWFLLSLGAKQRVQTLIKANPNTAESIFKSAKRLVDPKDMGKRFKVCCASSDNLTKPAGF